jgi:transposase
MAMKKDCHGRARFGPRLPNVSGRSPTASCEQLQQSSQEFFCRIKDWRRIVTRYDKLSRNFLAVTEVIGVLNPGQ